MKKRKMSEANIFLLSVHEMDYGIDTTLVYNTVIKIPRRAVTHDKLAQLDRSSNKPSFYIQFIGYTHIKGIVYYESEIGWESANETDIYTRYVRNRYSELRLIHDWIIKQNYYIKSPFPEKKYFGSESDMTARYRSMMFQNYFSNLNTIERISETYYFISCFGELT